jgi:uncharacterized membrane protein YhaH (DUF805 family)
MTMMNLLFSFQGRVNRARFWLVHLGIIVVEIAIFVIVGGAAMMADPEAAMAASRSTTSLLTLVLFVPIFWISLAVTVKRYHDRNKSGWWIFIVFVPLIGAIWYFIEVGFLPGTSGPNTYGADPLTA